MNEKAIWDFLIKKTNNPYGTAAIMGNLMAESSLSPICGTNIKRAGYSNISVYVGASDRGEHDFVHDGVAFGLAQWCYYTRKQALMDLAKSRGVSVGDLGLQLDYLYQEMSQKYKSVWAAVTGATDIRAASDIVMLKYEKPANTGDSARLKRASYGQTYYDQFARGSQSQSQTVPKPDKRIVVASANVNLRSGPGKSNARVGELKKGQSLEWIATEGGWYKAAVWVSGDFARTEA